MLCNSAEKIREKSMTYLQSSAETMFLIHELGTTTLHNHVFGPLEELRLGHLIVNYKIM